MATNLKGAEVQLEGPPDIAIFGAFRVWGGTNRRLLNQIHSWVHWGLNVELVTYRDGVKFYPDEVPKSVGFVQLGTQGKLASSFALWSYMRRRRPRVVLSVNHISNLVLAGTWRLPGVTSHRYLSVPNTFGESEKLSQEPRRRARKFRQICHFYPRSDGVIAVSDGVREDLLNTVGLKGVEVTRIYSGSVSPQALKRAEEPLEHPWFGDHRDRPVIVTVGRLVPQKDYANLLRAFALVLEERPARLVIVGGGRESEALEALARELKILEHVCFAGFQANPYPWMAKADVFALSSRWEGLVNVLLEALGLGTPVVSTDCPSGPREILADGRYGILVPMQDPVALADGLLTTLRGDGPIYRTEEAVAPFMAETAARNYLDYFGLGIASHGDQSSVSGGGS